MRNAAGDHRISRSVKFGRRSSNHSQGTGCASPPVPLPAHRQLNVVSFDLCRRGDGKDRDIDRQLRSRMTRSSLGVGLSAHSRQRQQNQKIFSTSNLKRRAEFFAFVLAKCLGYQTIMKSHLLWRSRFVVTARARGYCPVVWGYW